MAGAGGFLTTHVLDTARGVPAAEIKLALFLLDNGAREKAEQVAHEIARFPQSCVRADRRSVVAQHGLNVRDALIQEWRNGRPELATEGIRGAGRFSDGKGRHGDFDKIS